MSNDVAVPEARHVVGLLWDGCNSNSLYALAQSGQLPNVARLLAHGCAFRGGSIAEFPSVTLVNHTSALTGVGPGRHGIVNNAYFDRGSAVQVLTNNLLYEYTVHNLNGVFNSPTVTSGDTMNTGNIPFAQQPIYISYSPSGVGTTLFGGSNALEP